MPHRRYPGVLSERLEPLLRCRSYRKPTSGSACRRHLRTPLRITESPTDRTSPPEAPASAPNSGNPSAPPVEVAVFRTTPDPKAQPGPAGENRTDAPTVPPHGLSGEPAATVPYGPTFRPAMIVPAALPHESRIQMVLLRKNVRQVTGNTAIPTVHRHTEPAGQPTNGPQYFHRRDAATPNAPSHDTDPCAGTRRRHRRPPRNVGGLFNSLPRTGRLSTDGT